MYLIDLKNTFTYAFKFGFEIDVNVNWIKISKTFEFYVINSVEITWRRIYAALLFLCKYRKIWSWTRKDYERAQKVGSTLLYRVIFKQRDKNTANCRKCASLVTLFKNHLVALFSVRIWDECRIRECRIRRKIFIYKFKVRDGIRCDT